MSTTKIKHWTVAEYDAMLDMGILSERDRLELVNGQIIEMSPQNPPHAAATKRSHSYLNLLLQGSSDIRSQLPVVLNDDSKPEPDIAVVKVDEKDYSKRHPQADDIFLIIEVSDNTLNFDLYDKANAYAASGIADYWVVNVRSLQVHILRRPIDGVYVKREIIKVDNESLYVSPLAFPDVKVFLFKLLPVP